MKTDKKTLITPLLLIAVGTGWLLTTIGVAPGIDWVWTLGLSAVGLLAFIVGAFDKATFVIGTFFIVTSVLSVLRQTGRISFDVEVPILVIVSGVLLLAARHPAIPIPKWIIQPPVLELREGNECRGTLGAQLFVKPQNPNGVALDNHCGNAFSAA